MQLKILKNWRFQVPILILILHLKTWDGEWPHLQYRDVQLCHFQADLLLSDAAFNRTVDLKELQCNVIWQMLPSCGLDPPLFPLGSSLWTPGKKFSFSTNFRTKRQIWRDFKMSVIKYDIEWTVQWDFNLWFPPQPFIQHLQLSNLTSHSRSYAWFFRVIYSVE
jgi:hypothetical protein